MAVSRGCLTSTRGCLGLLQSMLKTEKAASSILAPVMQKRYRQPPRPMVQHDIEKPTFNVNNYDPEGLFSPAALRFMEARHLENGDGRAALVTNFKDGSPTGMIQLNNFVFGANPRIDIIHRVMVWQRACMRAGTACTKNRAQVRGGGRKPLPQKGTGKARQGSIRSPHMRGGGVTHGPIPRSYKYDLPYKVQKMGLRAIMSCRYAQGDLHIVESFDNLSPYEEDMLPILKKRGWTRATLVDGFENETLKNATLKIPKVLVNYCLDVNVLDILNTDKLILSLDAVEFIENRLCEDNRIITDPLYQFLTQEPFRQSHLDLLREEREPDDSEAELEQRSM